MRANLSQWAITHRTVVFFFMLLVAVAGFRAFVILGQEEDPPFTVKTMVVQAYLPGATLDETILQLTDRLERKLQETPGLDYLRSYTSPGKTTIFVKLLDSVRGEDTEDVWYQVRKKMRDIEYTMPAETVGPYFDDEFGDVYGIIYAFTGDGFTHREVKDAVESIRTRVLAVPDVEKAELVGDQEEKFYVEYSPGRLAKMGIGVRALASAIAGQNSLTPAGTVDTGRERVLVEADGRFTCAEDIADVTVYADGRRVRLGDVATVRKAVMDPPDPLYRFNGRDAVGLAITMSSGGNIIELGERLGALMKREIAELPVGMEAHQVADQAAVVADAVGEFTRALFEAVVIVMVISFMSLGLRAGLVVAFSIPLVLATVFLGMQILDINLQRISLGALIISLGLLIDDATITVESMVARLENGWSLDRAATYAYTTTAFPMLAGTLITVMGFMPIGLARSMAGEYTASLFTVMAIALLSSWFVAVLCAPAIGMRVLKPAAASGGAKPVPRVGMLARVFHTALMACLRHPKLTVLSTLAAFALSLWAAGQIPQQFFPPSTRPELLVDMTLRQGASIKATDEASRRLDAILAADGDVDHWTSYVGRGAIRFYLPMDIQLPNDFFTQTVVVAKDTQARERVRERLVKALAEEFPEVVGRAYAMELGPPTGWPVKLRVQGPDKEKVQEYARAVMDAMAASGEIENIHIDWGEPQRRMEVRVRQDAARRLGLSSSSIAQSVYMTVTGYTATEVRDGIYLTDVVVRARDEERLSLEAVSALDVPLADGGSVPLGVVADVSWSQEYPQVWRRDRLPTVTVEATAVDGVLAEEAAKRVYAALEGTRAALPLGYSIAIGGSVEESASSTRSVVAVVPFMLLLMLSVLIIQLQDVKHLVLVISVAPLGLIGIVLGLGVSGNPIGFIALTGVVALVGMIVRNAVILVHQVSIERSRGLGHWDAVVKATTVRFRPILLTAVTAILGMVPIAPQPFWSPMATAIIGGLTVATVLTLIFLPACYVLWEGVRPPEGGGDPGPGYYLADADAVDPGFEDTGNGACAAAAGDGAGSSR